MSETKTNFKNELKSAASLIFTFSLPISQHYHIHQNAPAGRTLERWKALHTLQAAAAAQFLGVSVLTSTWSSAAESFQFAALLLVWFPNPLAKSNGDPVDTAASCTLPSFGVYWWATARTLNDCFLTAFMMVERLFHN